MVHEDANAVIERLLAVPAVRPCDRSRVESALADHLRALALDPRPVRWIETVSDDHLAAPQTGFMAAWAALCNNKHGRPDAVGMTSTATRAALYGSGLRAGGVVGVADKEEKQAGRGVKRAARKAAQVARKRLEGSVGQGPHHHALERAVEEALAEKGMHRRTTMAQAIGSTPEAHSARQDAELDREISIGDAAAHAVEAATWFARAAVLRAAGKPADALVRVAQVYLPLVDAVEAGLWLFWVTEDDVIAVAAPAEE